MAKGVAEAGKDKSLSLYNANENERRGWDEQSYRKKNANPNYHYDWSRHALNFEIADGKIIPLGSQKFTLFDRYQEILRRLNYKEYKAGSNNQQNTYVEIMLSGSTEEMRQIAFGQQKVDYERNPKSWKNWQITRQPTVEQWAMDCYRFACNSYKAENIIGFLVHLDESEPHIHVCIVPTAMTRQRGKVGGYEKIDADGRPVIRTKGKHAGEIVKISTSQYEQLSEQEQLGYRPAVRKTIHTISYATLFGNSIKERSQKMKELHSEYYRQVGQKWGFERGDHWSDLPENERRMRRHLTKTEALEIRELEETKQRNSRIIDEQRSTIVYNNKKMIRQKEEIEEMAQASLFDKMLHAGLSPQVRAALKEREREHQETLRSVHQSYLSLLAEVRDSVTAALSPAETELLTLILDHWKAATPTFSPEEKENLAALIHSLAPSDDLRRQSLKALTVWAKVAAQLEQDANWKPLPATLLLIEEELLHIS